MGIFYTGRPLELMSFAAHSMLAMAQLAARRARNARHHRRRESQPAPCYQAGRPDLDTTSGIADGPLAMSRGAEQSAHAPCRINGIIADDALIRHNK